MMGSAKLLTLPDSPSLSWSPLGNDVPREEEPKLLIPFRSHLRRIRASYPGFGVVRLPQKVKGGIDSPRPRLIPTPAPLLLVRLGLGVLADKAPPDTGGSASKRRGPTVASATEHSSIGQWMPKQHPDWEPELQVCSAYNAASAGDGQRAAYLPPKWGGEDGAARPSQTTGDDAVTAPPPLLRTLKGFYPVFRTKAFHIVRPSVRLRPRFARHIVSSYELQASRWTTTGPAIRPPANVHENLKRRASPSTTALFDYRKSPKKQGGTKTSVVIAPEQAAKLLVLAHKHTPFLPHTRKLTDEPRLPWPGVALSSRPPWEPCGIARGRAPHLACLGSPLFFFLAVLARLQRVRDTHGRPPEFCQGHRTLSTDRRHQGSLLACS